MTAAPRRPDDRLRLFFALWPGAAVAAALHARACALRAGCGGRAMRRDTIHLTLAFLGELPAQDAGRLMAIAAGIRGDRFVLELDRIGAWHGSRILWSAPSRAPAALAALAAALEEGLRAGGFTLERRAFAPHLTLVRNARQAPPAGEAAPLRWPVASFVLVSSERDASGAHYRVLGRWGLGRSSAPDGRRERRRGA